MKKLTQKEILADAREFIDFLNTDLDEIGFPDKIRWNAFCLETIDRTDNIEEEAVEWFKQNKAQSCQKALRKAFKQMLRGEIVEILDKEEIKMKIVAIGENEDVDSWRIHIIYEAPTDEQTFLLYFFKAVEQVPRRAYGTCRHCGKYFLWLSKKERIYCNNICAVRHQAVLRTPK